MIEIDRDQPQFAPRPTSQMFIGGIVIPLLVLLAIGGFVLWLVLGASAELVVPDGDVQLVHVAPDETSPVVARFGANHRFQVTGRTQDWRWLEVVTWDGARGWALRPLDIFVWQIKANVVPISAVENAVPNLTLRPEEMVAISGGRFAMGSPPGLGDADESPVRTVTLSPFAIGRTEVTVGHYWECVIASACAAPNGQGTPAQPNYNNNPAFDNYPVINVTWEQADAYCSWRGQRLPTEAEWEMAAGWNSASGARSLWPWGNDVTLAVSNLGVNSAGQPAEVGSFTEDVSANGVLDMGGNVSEWVIDWYKVNYYSEADDTDPRGPTARRGDGTGRVLRGGSFADGVEFGRTANRGHSDPAYGRQNIGFRCVAEQQ